MAYPIKHEALRHQSVMQSLTYEEVCALADVTAGIVDAHKRFGGTAEDTEAGEHMAAACTGLAAKFAACALSLEALHTSGGE